MSLLAYNLGMPKSGTSTLQQALIRSGIKSLHWYDKATGLYVGQALYQRYFSGSPIMSDFCDAQIVTQGDLITYETSYWPQMDLGFLRQLQAENADVIFIMPVRDPQKVADSISRWGDLMDRLFRVGAPGLPPGMAVSKANIAHWVEAHYRTCRLAFPGLVEYDIEDEAAPKALSRALNIEIKWWGHANKNVGQVDHLKRAAK